MCSSRERKVFLLIYIGKYEEIVPNKGYESMLEHLEKGSYPNQKKIVHYLRSGNVDMVSAEIPKDCFTGERIPGEKLGMNDGEYVWWNTLAHYVEKYNLRLPKEFEEHILK